MAVFTYSARTKTGTLQKGTISARTKEAAFASLHQRELQPILVKPAAAAGLKMDIKLPGSDKVKPKDLVVFTRQFATMVSAGVPLLQSLTTLREQTESEGLKKALEQITGEIEGGGQLSDALKKHPKVFSEVYINMIRAGETAGILDQILDKLATQIEKDSAIKGKLKGALIYPGVITIVAIGAVTFLMTNIIPKLATILAQNGTELPIQTKLVLAVSGFLLHDWYFIIGFLVVAAVAFRQTVKRPGGRMFFDKVQLKIPIFGKVIMKVNVARFARTFSSLLGAGVTVIEALEVTSGALSNHVIQKALRDSIQNIKDGQSISDSLSSTGVLPQIIIQMAAVGEETGQLDTVLNKVAEFYEAEVDTVVASISSIIEPILIVGLGSIVGVIIASVMGPLSNLEGGIN